MENADQLKEYREKRHFDRTSELGGTTRQGDSGSNSSPRFVIQKHQARNLHYDFRLEIDGVLKSWAVPKGPSTNPGVKRLAMMVEDHPLDYVDFEGTIPEHEYGAGTVMVWDTGHFRNLKDKPFAEAIHDGQLEVWLEGKKLQGGYALVRMGDIVDHRWLLVKMRDEDADAQRDPEASQPESALTGRTLEEIAAEASHAE